MGFADSAISIIRNNRNLQKKTRYFKNQEINSSIKESKGGKKRSLSEESINRVKINQKNNFIKQIGLLLAIIIISFMIIIFLFF